MHFDAPYLVFRVVAVEAKRMCTHFVVVATLMHFVVGHAICQSPTAGWTN